MKRLLGLLPTLLTIISLSGICTTNYAQFPSEFLLQHNSRALEIAFSADGNWLAADGNDHKIYIWDVLTRSQIHVLDGHTGQITDLTFRRNGDLVSASEDGTVRLWNVSEEREIRRFRDGFGRITSTALSPDERLVVFGATDGTLRLWEADTGTLLRTFRGHGDVVLSVAFNHDGRQVISGSEDNTVRLWDVPTGTLIKTFRGHTKRVWSVAFHPSGGQLASGSWDGTVRMWESTSAMVDVRDADASTLPFAIYDRPVLSVEFSPDARLLAIGLANSEDDNSIKLWDVTSQSELWSFDTKSKHDVAFSPDGSLFATAGGNDAIIRVWHADPVTPLLLSPQEDTLINVPGADLQWEAVEDAIYYDVEIADNPDFVGDVQFTTLLADELTFSIESEQPQYWWRVRAGGFGKTSDWSEVQSFLTPFEPPQLCSIQISPRYQRIGLKQEFSLQILADSAPDLAGFQFDVRWTNPDLLTFVTVTEFRNILGASGLGQPGEIRREEGLYKGVAATKIGEAEVDNTGILLEVLFRSRTVGTSEIQLENFILVNSLQELIACSVVGATIIVEDPVRPWDVNQDGIVNVFDLGTVAKYFGEEISVGLEINPDVNGDGIVNLFDVVLVGRHFGETYENEVPAAPSSTHVNDEFTQLALRRIYNELLSSPDNSTPFLRTKQILRQLLSPSIPKQDVLLQNYPNPFNPETWMPFHITSAADVTMDIYNVHGLLVRRFSLGYRLPGRYITRTEAAYWDGKNSLGEAAATGIYFYTISMGTFSATKKMIVIK